MEALQDHRDSARKALEAALYARVEEVFDHFPGICGFSVAERPVPIEKGKEDVRESELYVTGIAAYPAIGRDDAEVFHGEISRALGDLLNQRPELANLVAGRTFARVWH